MVLNFFSEVFSCVSGFVVVVSYSTSTLLRGRNTFCLIACAMALKLLVLRSSFLMFRVALSWSSYDTLRSAMRARSL